MSSWFDGLTMSGGGVRLPLTMGGGGVRLPLTMSDDGVRLAAHPELVEG
jgi:hypothetical protein